MMQGYQISPASVTSDPIKFIDRPKEDLMFYRNLMERSLEKDMLHLDYFHTGPDFREVSIKFNLTPQIQI